MEKYTSGVEDSPIDVPTAEIAPKLSTKKSAKVKGYIAVRGVTYKDKRVEPGDIVPAGMPESAIKGWLKKGAIEEGN